MQMKAAVIYEAGGPEVLKLEERQVPKPAGGWVLIRVKAFGLNRSELFTRQGHSPGVAFPRILGLKPLALLKKLLVESSGRAMLLPLPWVAWGERSMVAMQGTRASRLARYRS